MKIVISSLKYIFKNFWYLLIFAIIPSALYSFANLDLPMVRLFESIITSESVSFFTIYSTFSIIVNDNWILSLVVIFVTILFLSLIISVIDSHMRMGHHTYINSISRLNNTLPSTIVVCMSFIAVVEIWTVILSGLISLFQLFLAGIPLFIITLILTFLMMVLLFYILPIFLVWLPSQTVTGYAYIEGLISSFELISKKINQLALAVGVPLIVNYILTYLISLLVGKYVLILTFLVYILFFMYFSTLMFTIYFDLTGYERMDIKKKF